MHTPPWWYVMIAAVLSSFLTAALVAAVAVKLTERKFCDIVIVLDEGYNAPVTPGAAPLSERGQRIAAASHKLRMSLGCD